VDINRDRGPLIIAGVPRRLLPTHWRLLVLFYRSRGAVVYILAPQSARRPVLGRVGDIAAMADRPLGRLFWRVADELHYLWTLATLRLLDALAGPLPETTADQQRARDRERIERAFPEIEREEPKGDGVIAVDEARERKIGSLILSVWDGPLQSRRLDRYFLPPEGCWSSCCLDRYLHLPEGQRGCLDRGYPHRGQAYRKHQTSCLDRRASDTNQRGQQHNLGQANLDLF
jgi:hypothetical protein